MAPREASVDLLPPSIRDAQTRDYQGRRARNAALIYFASLALLVALLAEGKYYFESQAEYAREQSEILRPLAQVAMRLEDENVRHHDKLALLEGLGGSRLIWAKGLHELGSLVPSGVWLTGIGSEERLRVRRRGADEEAESAEGRTVTSLTTLTIEGRGSSESHVARFLEALEQSPAIRNVRLDYVREREEEDGFRPEGVEFQIRLALSP
jgi:Tfp pilus assembly protein PilN